VSARRSGYNDCRREKEPASRLGIVCRGEVTGRGCEGTAGGVRVVWAGFANGWVSATESLADLGRGSVGASRLGDTVYSW